MNYSKAIERYEKIVYAFHSSITPRLKAQLTNQEYSKDIDYILETFFDELIDEEDIKELLSHVGRGDLPGFLSEYQLSLKDKKITESERKLLLRLCLNSMLYSQITSVSFSNAVQLIGNAPKIDFMQSGYPVCDSETYETLFKLGMPLYIIGKNPGDNAITLCNENELKEYTSNSSIIEKIKNGDMLPLVPTDYMITLSISRYIGQQYFSDFVNYCAKNSIAADKRLQDKYESYVQEVKLTYYVGLYRSYRHICGEKVNILDYKKQDSKFDIVITINKEDANRSDDLLLNDVLQKYVFSGGVVCNDVIEVLNDQKRRHFFYNEKAEKDNFIEIQNFTTKLFDESLLWDIIRENQDEIKTDGEIVIIPEKMLKHLSPDEQNAAKNILRNQRQIVTRNEDKAKEQRLDDIIARVAARKEKELSDKKAADENAQKAMSNRKSSGLLD